MQKLMKERLRELKRRQRRRRQMGIIAAFFGVIVIGGVVWGMTRPGVAMTGDATCGMEEHKHSDKCYENVLVCEEKESEGHKHDDSCYKTEEVLVCDKEECEANPEEGIEGHTHDKGCYEEKKELTCKEEESKGHTHSDKCYKEELSCGKEEHTHEEDCYIDRSADVEKKSDWDKQYKSIKWKDAWGEDLVTAAEKQVGYKESTKNYKKISGEQKGYTRYGEFSGEPYADWDAAFVNFCIHYAGISKSDVFPNTTDTNKWYNKFSKVNGSFLTAPDGYEPEKGDIVFFEKKKGETDFAMGIVSSSNKDKKEIKVIEGNIDNEVKEEKYGTGDSQIFAYIKVTELEQAFKGMESDDAENKEEQEETEEPAETEEPEGEETEEPSPAFDSEYDGDGVIIHVKADEGVVPEGAELSVTPIEKKKITSDMSAEEKEEAEKVNAQYDMTNEKLNEESEKNEQELQGFLAYDISFMLDGKEIEPNGEVKVTMDFKEAVAPEEVSKDAMVAVNHLKENGNGGVKVENLTEADTTNIKMAGQDVAVEKVELVADNFSIFTITWWWETIAQSMGNLGIEFIDEDGNPLVPKDNDKLAGDIQLGFEPTQTYVLKEEIESKGRWTSIVVVENSKEILYEPVKMQIDGVEVEKVRFENGMWCFMNSSSEVPVTSFTPENLRTNPLQIVFKRTAVAEIEIVDNIKTTGNLDADPNKLTGTALEEFNKAIAWNEEHKAQTKEIKFVWYKRVNSKDQNAFQIVRNEEFSGKRFKITGDYENSLNVALDEGALGDGNSSVEYKVELYIDNQKIGASSLKSIEYYCEVQNGSFEAEQLTGGDGKPYEHIPQKEVSGWSTTSACNTIEIGRVSDSGYINDSYYIVGKNNKGENIYDTYPFGSAADGKQFAELNSSSVGSLYQDILVAKGTVMNYEFSHRARKRTPSMTTNKMYLLIVPTFVAERGINPNSGSEPDPIDTQSEVKELIKNKDARDPVTNELLYPGVFVEECESPYEYWKHYKGTYVPEYDLNRFYFVSAEEEYPHEANFLDKIWFSQTLPKPEEGKFNFQLIKKIDGLEDEETLNNLKKNIEFDIKVTDTDGKLVEVEGLPKIIKSEDMEWSSNSDYGVYNKMNLPINNETYKVTVTEKSNTAIVDSYDLFTNVTAERLSSSSVALTNVSTDNLLKKDSVPQTSVFDGVVNSVVKGNTAKITFTNSYSIADNFSWLIVKRSASDGTTPLEGASFSLIKEEADIEDQRTITGTSNGDGEIDWIVTNGDTNEPLDPSILNGNFILKETKAPDGYSCSEKQWTLTFNNGKLDAVALAEQIKTDEKFIVLNTKDDVHEISIYNARLYELPSTGGKGIYLYMFSGILLMVGGLLMTYKNRRRGVLRS